MIATDMTYCKPNWSMVMLFCLDEGEGREIFLLKYSYICSCTLTLSFTHTHTLSLCFLNTLKHVCMHFKLQGWVCNIANECVCVSSDIVKVFLLEWINLYKRNKKEIENAKVRVWVWERERERKRLYFKLSKNGQKN